MSAAQQAEGCRAKNTCHIPVNLKHSIMYLSVVFTKLRLGSQELVFKGNWSISVKIYAIQ